MSAVLTEAVAVGGDFTEAERQRIVAFLFREARLADESRYDEWELLVDEQMLYWVPGAHSDPDPDRTVSLIADNRSRLHNRILQLKTGRRLAQQPVSPMRRLLGNIELERMSSNEVRAFCNFTLHEYRVQSLHRVRVWAGRYEYHLREKPDGSLRMFCKRVDLIDVAGAVPSLAFLI